MADPVEIPAPTLGVRPDLDIESVPGRAMWKSENVIFRDGDFRVRPGFTNFSTDVNERPLGYISYRHADGTYRIVLATNAGMYKYSGGTWTSITGSALTGGATDHVVFRTFSKAAVTWLLATNGANTLKVWDGSTATYANAGGSPPRARCMMTIFDRVILGNLLSGGTISPVAIDVSANKDFDAGWGSVLVALLAETEGAIISMEEMGTLSGAILKGDSIYMLIAQGGTNPFRIQQVKTGISGPASQKMTTKFPNGGIGIVGRDGLASIFDGSNLRLLKYAIQKQIVSTANLDEIERGWTLYDSDRREWWIVFPLHGSTECNGGVILTMDNEECYPIRFPNHAITAGGHVVTLTGLTIGELTSVIGDYGNLIGDWVSTSKIGHVVLGDVGGLSMEELGNTDAGSGIPFFWQTPVKGQMQRYSTFKRLRHRFAPTPMAQNITVEVGKRNQGGEVTYGDARTVNIGSMLRRLSGYRTTAEYFGLKFSGTGTQEIIYQGSAAYTKARGER